MAAQPPPSIMQGERHHPPMPVANMPDYGRARAEFSWDARAGELDGLPGGGPEHRLRGGRPARRRARGGPPSRCAGSASVSAESRLHLRRARARRPTGSRTCCAALGVGRGERVFVLAGRIPELYVAALGTLKHGSVFCPLFSAFGPEPIGQRLALGDGARARHDDRALPAQGRRRCAPRCPDLEHVLLVGDDATRSRTIPDVATSAR